MCGQTSDLTGCVATQHPSPVRRDLKCAIPMAHFLKVLRAGALSKSLFPRLQTVFLQSNFGPPESIRWALRIHADAGGNFREVTVGRACAPPLLRFFGWSPRPVSGWRLRAESSVCDKAALRKAFALLADAN